MIALTVTKSLCSKKRTFTAGELANRVAGRCVSLLLLSLTCVRDGMLANKSPGRPSDVSSLLLSIMMAKPVSSFGKAFGSITVMPRAVRSRVLPMDPRALQLKSTPASLITHPATVTLVAWTVAAENVTATANVTNNHSAML